MPLVPNILDQMAANSILKIRTNTSKNSVARNSKAQL